MEKNKRIKNTILLGFFISLFVLVIFIVLLYFWIYPNISEISATKQTLSNDYKQYKTLTNSGISFNDFKATISQNSDTKDDIYLKFLLNSSGSADFYNKNIINYDSGLSFSGSLNKKSKILDLKKQKNEEKIAKINKILPMYNSNSVNLVNEGVISDFILINKMESLFKTFELDYGNTLSISDITPLNYSSTGSVESDIYKIPMKMKISGSKLNLQNFIHYLENVGNIDVEDTGTGSENNKDIKIYNDDFIKTRSSLKIAMYNDNIETIDGNKLLNSKSNYNIYNNQVVNITSIKVNNDYIDETVSDTTNIELDVELSFYVRGLPLYNIQNFIQDFIKEYRSLLKDVNKELGKHNSNYKKVSKINDYLKNLDNDIASIEKSIKGKKDKDTINDSYKIILKYNNSFKTIKKAFYDLLKNK